MSLFFKWHISSENTDLWLQISYGAEYEDQNNEDSVMILSNEAIIPRKYLLNLIFIIK